MTFTEFKTRLRKLNRRLVAIPGAGRIAGLYLYMPKHPISNPETGLKHLGGMPSPFFYNLPKYSFWDDSLGGFNKGTDTVLRTLSEWRFAGKTIIKRGEAMAEFGYFPSFARLPERETPEWWAKKRMKQKYQLQNSKGSGQLQGAMAL